MQLAMFVLMQLVVICLFLHLSWLTYCKQGNLYKVNIPLMFEAIHEVTLVCSVCTYNTLTLLMNVLTVTF